MKNLIIIMAMGLLPCMAVAQDAPVNPNITDTTLNLAREQYCIVRPRGKLFSRRITLDIDYGLKLLPEDGQSLLDNDGKEIVFNSIVDGLNYMARQGWLFVNTMVKEEGTTYLFRRALPSPPANTAETK
jgi:hypothetical protein